MRSDASFPVPSLKIPSGRWLLDANLSASVLKNNYRRHKKAQKNRSAPDNVQSSAPKQKLVLEDKEMVICNRRATFRFILFDFMSLLSSR